MARYEEMTPSRAFSTPYAADERVDASYEQASVPVIVSQLRLAGVRLASVLKAAFPGP